MPIVIVDQETDAAGLAARLLKARTSKAAAERAVRAIRDSNPGLDPDRLLPGTMVVVPHLKGLRVATGDVLAPAVGEFLYRVREALVTLETAADAALESDRAEREETAEVFDSEEVRAAAQEDEVLRNTLELLRQTLAADGTDAEERTADLHSAVEGWNTELDVLSGMV